MSIERLGAVDDQRNQRLMQLLEERFREASADVTDGLIGITVGVVGSKEEGTIDRGTLSTSIVRAQNNQVERVANAS